MSKYLYDSGEPPILREWWDDELHQVTMYDATGVIVPPTIEVNNPRPYTPAEEAEAAVRVAQDTAEDNKAVLHDAAPAASAITELEARIGSGTYVATGIQDPLATITSLSLMSNPNLAADFQANTGRWLKFLLRTDKRLSNQTIRALRHCYEQFESSSIGDET